MLLRVRTRSHCLCHARPPAPNPKLACLPRILHPTPQVQYKESRLVIKVGANGADPGADMRVPSGGERSLATVAFILALGEPSTETLPLSD